MDKFKENLKSEIVYLNDNDEIVDKEKATKGIIRELDEDGNLVRETFGTFKKPEEKIKTDDELSEETKRILSSINF